MLLWDIGDAAIQVAGHGQVRVHTQYGSGTRAQRNAKATEAPSNKTLKQPQVSWPFW